MNGWRWLIMVLFLAGMTGLGLSAYGDDKDKKPSDKQADKKPAGKTPADDKDKVELLPKAFEGKEPFYQELITTTTQKMTVMQQNITQEQKQTFWFSWTPKEKKDGKFTVVQKILGVKMDIDIGGNKISFDSRAAEQPKNPMTEFFRTLVGAEFQLTISENKDGRYAVDEVKGVDTFVSKLGSVNQAMQPLLKQILTPESIKQMAEPMLGVIPAKGVVPANKSWSSQNTLDMGPIGKYTTDNKYTYEGPADKKTPDLVKIKVVSDLTYAAPAAGGGKGLPFQIVKGDSTKLKSKDSGGWINFDTKKGRVDSAEMTVKLEGSLQIEIANMQTTVELNQTQVSKLKTSDTNPIESSKK